MRMHIGNQEKYDCRVSKTVFTSSILILSAESIPDCTGWIIMQKFGKILLVIFLYSGKVENMILEEVL